MLIKKDGSTYFFVNEILLDHTPAFKSDKIRSLNVYPLISVRQATVEIEARPKVEMVNFFVNLTN